MKTTIQIIALIVVAILLCVSCKTVPTGGTSPNGPSCTLQFTGLGNNLIAAAFWTNAATGDHGSGTSFYPECGSSITYFVDPSISCSTNQPNVAMLTWTCKTNLPVVQFIKLPVGCNGAQFTVSCYCTNCSFNVSQQVGFSCFIQKPEK